MSILCHKAFYRIKLQQNYLIGILYNTLGCYIFFSMQHFFYLPPPPQKKNSKIPIIFNVCSNIHSYNNYTFFTIKLTKKKTPAFKIDINTDMFYSIEHEWVCTGMYLQPQTTKVIKYRKNNFKNDCCKTFLFRNFNSISLLSYNCIVYLAVVMMFCKF